MEKLRRGPLPDGFKNVGKHFLRLAPTSLAVALAVACSGEKDSNSPQLQVTPRVGESGTLPNPENPFAVLGMPFPKNQEMAIQQGWFYSDKTLENREHKGIDYIKGEPNNSRTWKSFPVTAAADGKACANPPSRQGNAVLITHSVGEKPIGSTYYGHLQKSEKDIPECSTGQTVFKGKGDKIGEAGSTGVQDQSWIHLHLQVNDANGNPIDPYDLEGERNVYPKPDFSDVNQKPCGSKALFTDCYPKGAVVAGPKFAPPPISGSVKEKSASPTTNIEKPAEKGWTQFKSSVLPYQIDYPSGWQYSGDTNARIDIFNGQLVNGYLTYASVSTRPMNISVDELIKLKREGYKTAIGTLPEVSKTTGQFIENYTNVLKVDIYTPKDNSSANRRIHNVFYFISKDNRLLWEIGFGAEESVFDQELLKFNKMIGSFKFLDNSSAVSETPKPTEIQRAGVEKKISISKKPEELYKTLLTNMIPSNVLPQGMISKGISASEIDATGKALRQIGAVNILIEDSVSILSGKVFYGIFPDSSTAKSASELIGTHLGDGQVLKDFPYPTKIYTTETNVMGLVYTATTVLVTSVENVTVITSLTNIASRSPNANLVQSRTISLGQAAIEHLGKIGK